MILPSCLIRIVKIPIRNSRFIDTLEKGITLVNNAAYNDIRVADNDNEFSASSKPVLTT